MYDTETPQRYMVPPSTKKRSRVPIVAGLVAVVVFVAVMVFTVFQPHKLFIDERVSESFGNVESLAELVPTPRPDTATSPTDATSSTSPAGEAPPATTPPAPTPLVLAVGEFQSLDHPTVGQAYLVRDTDGGVVVRLENFETDNGPDLYVSLSTHPAGSREYSSLTNLARLKGNVGAQNYEVPAEVDLANVQSVVIWCQRFGSAFGDAPLTPPQ